MTQEAPDQLVLVKAADLSALVADVAELKQMVADATNQAASDWLPRKAACEHLSVTPRTLDRMVQDGRLKAKGAGTSRRFKVR